MGVKENEEATGRVFSMEKFREGGVSFVDNEYDLFMKEIKDDLREREARNESRQNDLESRIEKNIDLFRSESRDREDRYRNEAKEREDRYRNEAKEREVRYQAKALSLENQFQKTADGIQDLVKDMKKDNKSTTFAIWTLSISTILGIAAMIVTVLLTK
ncbi:hypothetical protein [Listeria booriae]|uniref:Uncharacterized protein n=1 Tax=Listeria booriae TaxID=1552123 RepID=A0A842FH83_9LIST|nr:hypothetical protein [Listeria booriae]MBC1287001.1 hypothetical protein [Listeria booriae]MBC2242366.1 hypothetical protein [Listeria booriae]